jgi:hypothetical protein
MGKLHLFQSVGKLASNCLIYQLKIVKGILDRVAAMQPFRTDLQGERDSRPVLVILVC